MNNGSTENKIYFKLGVLCIIIIIIHHSEVTSSQPVHAGTSSNDDIDGDRNVVIESFTQPSRFDELIVGTQIPCTPGASQVRIYIRV